MAKQSASWEFSRRRAAGRITTSTGKSTGRITSKEVARFLLEVMLQRGEVVDVEVEFLLQKINDESALPEQMLEDEIFDSSIIPQEKGPDIRSYLN